MPYERSEKGMDFIMKFIFPKNYRFRQKLFGFIDYSTILINLIWFIVVFLLLQLFSFDFMIKIFIFILFCFPVFLMSMFGFQGENLLSVCSYLFSFIRKPKVLLFIKYFRN